MAQHNEQDLFSMTQFKWLYNNEQQLALRYVPFNVEALIDIAVQSADATRCVSFKKISEGTMNRVFALKCDNDVDFIVKIPFPITGPKHLCTASEVATLDYLLTELGIPVPEVCAWSSHAEETPVGAEFIMYEQLPGTSLSDFDKSDFPMHYDPYIRLLPLITRIESELSIRGFSQIGSLYYKEDVPQHLHQWPLYSDSKNETTNSERFRIGPTIERDFWRAGRSTLNIDRGPWPNDRAYMFALGACTRASIEAGLEPDPDGVYHHLISIYEQLVPHMAPRRTMCTLWHPDLHAGNIIVDGDIEKDPDSLQLSGIIDWQGSVVLPYYMQFEVPPAYEFDASDYPVVQYSPDGKPKLADEYENLWDDEKVAADHALRRAWRAYLHQLILREEDARLEKDLYGIKGANRLRVATRPATTIAAGGSSLASIARSIANVERLWNLMVELDADGRPLHPFPSAFSEDDKRLAEEGEARYERSKALVDGLLPRLGMRWEGEGLVLAEKYEEAKQVLEAALQAALAAAPSEEDRQRIAEEWPFQDGKFASSADRCW
ncbi:kinase-like domain-containing protein [Schizophyllum amplum]|uniref:Kinase-like domain-containing protein n=1 Tax=Schizophyllum amplum TaxID=97359 RepID=A0A550C110_9AGAR|nr:kinase-like domain-containing protein [Auriculariopsis ampla]